jgi:phosphohistidine phosphatase
VRIFLVRHAEAIPREGAVVLDEERWLTEPGRSKFRKVAKRFRRLRPEPIEIVTSPLVRAVQTADILADEIGDEGEISVWPGLKPEVSPKAVLLRLASLDADRRIALVGHEPQMSGLAAGLLGRREFPLPFPKGAIACIDVKKQRGSRRVSFRWLLVPKGRRFLGLDGNVVDRPQ